MEQRTKLENVEPRRLKTRRDVKKDKVQEEGKWMK